MTGTEKCFLGISPSDLAVASRDPAREITAVWFGFSTRFDRTPEHFEIQVTGRSQFKLSINGTAVLFGPCRSAKPIAYYDTLDAAPFLRAGENRFIFQVFSYPEDTVHLPPECHGPTYCFGDNDGPAVSLDGSFDRDPRDPDNWYVWLDEGQSFLDRGTEFLGASERVDGEIALRNPLLQETWDDPRLTHPAVVQSATYDLYGTLEGKRFEPRPIPLLYRKERRFAAWEARTVPAHETVEFVLDAGELTTAFFRIGFRGGRGSEVEITYAESWWQRDEDGTPYKAVRDDTTGFIEGFTDDYRVGGDDVYEPFRFRTFRFVQIEIETGDEPLTVVPQPYIETAYPLRNCKKPVFRDPAREKLYDVAFRTLQLCAHDTYEDCPYYEQLMYACDTRLEMLFTYAATDDTALPRQAIRLFADSLQPNGLIQSRYPSRRPQVIPSFSLYFILMLEDYAVHTGDLDFIRPYLPVAERILDTFLLRRTESGMLAPHGYWEFYDWTPKWSDFRPDSIPTAIRDGESALQNLLFVYAAQSLCRLLPEFHRADLALYYESECAEILNLVEARCWVPERGLYREGGFTDEYTQQTQIFAVLTGLLTGERAEAVMEKVLTDGSLIPCSFMQTYYLFRALESVGMYDRAAPLWKTWQDFLDLHCTTFPETPFRPRSDCHAWSSLPLTEFASGD